MNDKNLHPHTALWIVSAVVLLGVLFYGTYLWNGNKSSVPAQDIMNNSSSTTQNISLKNSQSLLDSLKSASSTAGQPGKAPTVDNKTLNSLKQKSSAPSSGKVNNSLLDSLKAN